MSDFLLQVSALHVAYGAIRALHGLSFGVRSGQVVSLIGANGAGKSTTLNTISGLLKPASGQIVFDGTNITGWRADRVTARGIVQVPEGRQVIAPMSVIENLEMGAYLRHDSEIQRDLDLIFTSFPKLAERRNQKAGSLSGGEQQMLAVGRALMARPRLLMLDEPSMGLAPLLVNEVFRIIGEIKAQGNTILLVEQNARKALQVADYAYVLERGQIAYEGEASVLREDPRVIAAYLGEARRARVDSPETL
jgi:branched-chain amino acid transport system ATP-binding protein